MLLGRVLLAVTVFSVADAAIFRGIYQSTCEGLNFSAVYDKATNKTKYEIYNENGRCAKAICTPRNSFMNITSVLKTVYTCGIAIYNAVPCEYKNMIESECYFGRLSNATYPGCCSSHQKICRHDKNSEYFKQSTFTEFKQENNDKIALCAITTASSGSY